MQPHCRTPLMDSLRRSSRLRSFAHHAAGFAAALMVPLAAYAVLYAAAMTMAFIANTCH